MIKEVKHYRCPVDFFPSVPELKFIISKCVVDDIEIDLELRTNIFTFDSESACAQARLITHVINITADSTIADIQAEINRFDEEIEEYKSNPSSVVSVPL